MGKGSLVFGRIDVEALLEPIAESGVGGDLRQGGSGSEAYLRLKDARAAARTAEREASNDAGSDPLNAGLSNWSSLADGAMALLATDTKDIEIAAWLTEALLRIDYIGGLADGFALIEGLIARYWDAGLWPAADDEGDETRLSALFGLFGRGGTGTLLQPLKLVALSDRGGTPVTLWSAELAAAPAAPRSADEDAQAVVDERRAAALEAVATGIGRSSKACLIKLRADLVRACNNLDALMEAVDRVSDVGRFGSQIGQPLETALRLLDDHAVFDIAEIAASPAETSGAETAGDGGVTGGAGRGAPGSREEALLNILALAEYFDRREPQSPIGLSLREVVRRARLPLEALLSELLPDAASRTLFLQRAGIRSASADTETFD